MPISLFCCLVTLLLQVKTGLGEAMEGIGDDLLEEYTRTQDQGQDQE